MKTLWKLAKWSGKIMIFLIGLLFRCNSDEKGKNKTQKFNGSEIKDKNFILLNSAFGKDATTVYYKSRAFQYADVASFEALDTHYARDKKKVYYCDEYREGQNYYLTKKQTITEITDAHPESFRLVENGYALDNHQAYFEGLAFPVKDLSTFKVINAHFSKDDVSVYLNRRIIAESEGKSFELLDDRFARDSKHIYYYDLYNKESQMVVLPCDQKTFQIVDNHYSKDGKQVFYLGYKIKGANPLTFLPLGDNFSKDESNVYFEDKLIKGADGQTFKVDLKNADFTYDVPYAKDGQFVYYGNQRIKGANVSTFNQLGQNYGHDNLHVYYKALMVNGARPESFIVYPHDIGDTDAEDSVNKYYCGKRIRSVNE